MATAPAHPGKQDTFACLGPHCTQIRKPGDTWFFVSEMGGQFFCRPLLAGAAMDKEDKPVCGAACAHKLFDDYISRSIEERKDKARS